MSGSSVRDLVLLYQEPGMVCFFQETMIATCNGGWVSDEVTEEMAHDYSRRFVSLLRQNPENEFVIMNSKVLSGLIMTGTINVAALKRAIEIVESGVVKLPINIKGRDLEITCVPNSVCREKYSKRSLAWIDIAGNLL